MYIIIFYGYLFIEILHYFELKINYNYYNRVQIK